MYLCAPHVYDVQACMYVCMYVYVCTYIHVCNYNLYVCMYVCANVCM